MRPGDPPTAPGPRPSPWRLPRSEAGPTLARTRALPARGSARPLRLQRAGEPGLSGGRLAGRAGGGWRPRGGDRFMGRAAGGKEALVSQAGRIPARGAHLSGQEPGAAAAAGPAPRKRLRLPRRPAPAPRPPAAGAGEEPPPSLQSSPGRRASPPLQAADSGARLPRAGGGLLAPGSARRPPTSGR